MSGEVRIGRQLQPNQGSAHRDQRIMPAVGAFNFHEIIWSEIGEPSFEQGAHRGYAGLLVCSYIERTASDVNRDGFSGLRA